MLAHNVALRVDEHQCGPGPAGILLPHLKLAIVDYRVFKLVAADGIVQVAGVLLIGEFGRMDADHNQFFGILLFESPQLRKDMGAVDSTVSPEIQNHDLAPELFHGQRTVGIDPLQGIGKF